MKIGILSLYKNGYNFGAQLQAYALCKYLNKYGEAEQIQYLHQHTDLYEWFKHIPSAELMDNFSMSISHSPDVYDNCDISYTLDDYDVFVCGSDQIWGEKVYIPYENTAIFSLSFVPADKVKIAYAASMGSASVSGRYDEVLRGSLSTIDHLSAREKSAIPYLEEVSGKKVEWVVDPVFLIDEGDWDFLAKKPDIDKPFDVVYALSDSNKKVAYKGKNQIINIDPNEYAFSIEEFLGLIKYADNIITDSFHAAAFSIIFKKNFVVLSKDPDLDTRLIDLLNSFEINKTVYKNTDDISKLINIPISYSNASIKMESYRKKSIEFLDNAFYNNEKKNCIVSDNKCVGCGLCQIIAPIYDCNWVKGTRGFYYPRIESEQYETVELCRSVCPVWLKEKENRNAILSDSTMENTEYHRRCSIESKGDDYPDLLKSDELIKRISEWIVSKDGVVYGTGFDEKLHLVGRRAKSIDEVGSLSFSRCVQGDIRNIYRSIKQDLIDSRQVFIFASPCQIAAIRSLLKEDPDNLITFDYVCRGNVSDDFYGKYLNNHSDIFDSAKEVFERIYSEGFLYRDCCHKCMFRGINRISDITLGGNDLADSVKRQNTHLYTNSRKGLRFLNDISSWFDIVPLDIHGRGDYEWEYMNDIIVQPYSSFIDCIYKTGNFADIYNRFVECDQRKSESVFYRRKVITANCERKLMAFSDNEVCAESIIIYGLSSLGKLLYAKLKNKPTVILDRDPKKQNYMGTSVLRPEDKAVSNYIDGTTIVVTLITDDLSIIRMLKKLYRNTNVITIADFLGE